jgi:ubiquitin-protein ligase
MCLDILNFHWSPAITLQKVISVISEQLIDPNPKEALESYIATEY